MDRKRYVCFCMCPRNMNSFILTVLQESLPSQGNTHRVTWDSSLNRTRGINFLELQQLEKERTVWSSSRLFSAQAFILEHILQSLFNLVLYNSNGKFGRIYYSLKYLAPGNYHNDNKDFCTF